MRPVEILTVIQSVSEPHAMHSGAYGGEDAIFGIFDCHTVGRNLGEFRGRMKIHGGIRLTDTSHIVCAHESGKVVLKLEAIDNRSNPYFRRR